MIVEYKTSYELRRQLLSRRVAAAAPGAQIIEISGQLRELLAGRFVRFNENANRQRRGRIAVLSGANQYSYQRDIETYDFTFLFTGILRKPESVECPTFISNTPSWTRDISPASHFDILDLPPLTTHP